MGYETQFRGKIFFDREIDWQTGSEIESFRNTRHNYGSHRSPWSHIKISQDGKSMEWDGGEKTYDLEFYVTVIINKFLVPNGYTCNGQIDAQGQGMFDFWAIEVEKNKVYRITYKFIEATREEIYGDVS